MGIHGSQDANDGVLGHSKRIPQKKVADNAITTKPPINAVNPCSRRETAEPVSEGVAVGVCRTPVVVVEEFVVFWASSPKRRSAFR
jgi:hypothetical protein